MMMEMPLRMRIVRTINPMGRFMINRQKGFTLLEVVIALVILSMNLMWILMDQTNAVKRSVRARLLTQATYLARSKMVETEALLRKDGFGTFEEEDCGEFDSGDYEGSERFTYCVQIEKIELPDMNFLQEKLMGGLGMGQEGAGDEGSDSPLSGLMSQFMPGAGDNPEIEDKFASMAGQFLAPALGMIQGVLEEAIRKVTVTVFYKSDRKTRKFELVAYFTDVEELNRSILGGLSMPTAPQSGTSPSTTTPAVVK
jgi:prepilin-type N-terminal cleavage/methylation domain-containing protein